MYDSDGNGIIEGDPDGVVGSEFAAVEVRIDTHGNSPRLRVRDLRTGRVRYLDALELEAIVRVADSHLSDVLDPFSEADDVGDVDLSTPFKIGVPGAD